MNVTTTQSHSAPRPAAGRFLHSRRWRLHRLVAPFTRGPQAEATQPGAAFRAGLVALGLGLLAIAPSSGRADPLDNWHNRPAVDSNMGNESVYVNGRIYAAGHSGRVMHSAGAQSWQVVQTPASVTLVTIAHGGGQFVAGGNTGTILTSPDGQTWTQRNSGTDKQIRSIAYGNNRYVAVGTAGTVLHSPDAVTWTASSFPLSGYTAMAVSFGHGMFVAIGEGNDAFTSTDGANWTRQATGFYSRAESMTFGNGRFVATGWDRVAVTSTDGINWTKTTLTLQYANTRLWEVRYYNGRFIAGGQHGALASSTDGTNWTTHPTGSTGDIGTFVYDGGQLVIIRSSGAVRVSDAWAPVADGGDSGNGGGGAGSGNGNGGDNGGGNGGSGGGDTPPATDPGARLVNLSTRAWVGTGNDLMIAGFYVNGSTPKKLLVRAVGPSLAPLGVNGALADPQMKLVDAAGTERAANDDWQSATNHAEVAQVSASVGAFALPANSKDAALVVTLAPGPYTLLINGANNGTGIALAEVYDAETGQPCRLVNISSRIRVGSGEQVAITGFYVSGNGPRQLLVRGIGPGLAPLGVNGAIANPKIALYTAAGQLLAENEAWSSGANAAQLAQTMGQVGAFALTPGSLDAAMLVTAQPGAYTVIVSGVGGSTGVALLELYEVP